MNGAFTSPVSEGLGSLHLSEMEPCHFDDDIFLSLARCEGGGGPLGGLLARPWAASNNADVDCFICPTTESPIEVKKQSLRKRKHDKMHASSGNANVSKSTNGGSNPEIKSSERSDLSHKSGRKGHDISPETSKVTDVQKTDYIHVRARRGQATDSHSLAERVRREKISARMKCLQNLVPGCNKVMGKAGVLDEIINYVQSLQRQVEGLHVASSCIPAEEMNSINRVKLEPMHGFDEGSHMMFDSIEQNFVDPYHEAIWENEMKNVYNIDFEQQLEMCINSNQLNGYVENVDGKIEMCSF